MYLILNIAKMINFMIYGFFDIIEKLKATGQRIFFLVVFYSGSGC